MFSIALFLLVWVNLLICDKNNNQQAEALDFQIGDGN